jgi:hypothetical protein
VDVTLVDERLAMPRKPANLFEEGAKIRAVIIRSNAPKVVAVLNPVDAAVALRGSATRSHPSAS